MSHARWLFVGALFTVALFAESRVTLTVDTAAAGFTIPPDYLGLSFESSNVLPEKNGDHFFGAENQALIALFRKLGIRSLRVGGGTADIPRYAIPGEKDIDQLFAFAAAADVHVIYTLRLPHADIERDTAVGKYIAEHYVSRLTCFEIGNEPDFYRRVYREIPDYATYRGYWKKIADAVMKAAPGAKFCGPAAGGVTAFSRSFAEDFARSGFIAAIVQHEYTGGDGNMMSGVPARDAMMSRAWMEQYDRLYNSFAVTAQANHLPYRLEETNNFTGGAKDATDTFSAALWALDYLHWWAVHGAAGMNFHNRRWILNTTIYPVKPEDDGLQSGYRVHPIAYGIEAFDLGGHGAVVPVAIADPDALNLTAYAVRDGGHLYVTVINKKDPGVNPPDAKVTLQARGWGSPSAAYLTAPGGLAAKEGITLSDWTPLEGMTVSVPGASAAVIKLTERETSR